MRAGCWLLICMGLVCFACNKPAQPPDSVVRIPGGKFFMGYNSGSLDEKPEHEVELADFYIAVTEVTNAEYEKFDPSHQRSKRSRGGNMPVCDLSWEQAEEYCRWLGQRNPGTFRLPTEAEWEYASRGPENYLYGYGDEYVRGIAATDRAGAVGVDKYEPNGFGLYGMCGNASEWVADSYSAEYYEECAKKEMVRNPRGPGGKTSSKVIRGPSYLDRGKDCRLTRRAHISRRSSEEHIGFRCVWEP